MPKPSKEQLAEYTRQTGLDFYTNKPPKVKKPETSVDKLARVRAEAKLETFPAEETTRRIEATTKRKVAVKKATPKKGRTIEEAATGFGERAETIGDLEVAAKEAANTKIESELGELEGEDRETKRKELETKIDPMREILRITGEDLADSSQMLINMQELPQEMRGDVDVVFRNVRDFEPAVKEFQQRIETNANQIKIELKNTAKMGMGTELGIADEYMEELVQKKAREDAIKDSPAYDYPIEEMEKYVSIVKRGINAK